MEKASEWVGGVGASLDKQLKKHIEKFNEAKERGAEESMDYMAREMADYLKRMEILKKRLRPKK